MRYVLEVEHTPDGRVVGTVAAADAQTPVAFSGWLELLGLLTPIPPSTTRQEANDVR